MKVYVELAECLDVAEWGARHARGEVPDATPYGLHRIATADATAPVLLAFRAPPTPRLQLAARKVRGRLGGIDPLPTMLDRRRSSADVVLCMDERAGVPAALRGGPPVVTGIAWADPAVRRPGPRGRLADRVVRTALQRCTAIFTQSGAFAEVLRSSWDLDPEAVHEVRLGIDVDFFTERPWPERPGVVFSVGDDRMRDHATLVAAVQRVVDGGVPARLELGTTLPVDLPERLGRVHRRRLGPAVRDHYAAAEVVALALHPAKRGNGLTALLETMASGRPLVVTDNPGLERYVEHGVTGLRVPAHDPDAMAGAIAALLTDPERARAMGRAARRRVEQEFSTAHMAGDLLAVLRSAAG